MGSQHTYRHFNVAIYTRAYEVRQMADLDWLASVYDVISRRLKVDKIYLETHRDTLIPDEATLLGAKQFFADRGVETAGGITYTVNERNRYETYCYTRAEHRQKVKEIAEYTARFFDEIILDDFFFTSCKCPECVAAKGDRSWTEYRLALMADAARDLVIEPARAVNPNVEVVIKYPNWYEHFQASGFNLEVEPALFDRVYTGTETRDPVLSNQHLQPYQSYQVFRYFDSLKPGGNGGGWVDTGGMFTLDRYAEQLWLTLFAKAPEVTLFDFRQMQYPVRPSHRAPWQDRARSGIGFEFDTLLAWAPEKEAPAEDELAKDATVALVAAHAFEQVEPVLGELGAPVGVRCYKPYHSSGEDFLHNYLGMLGIPIDMRPTFPTAGTVLLTETAKADPEIVDKIRDHLLAGHDVVMTSGLYGALQGQPPGPGYRIEDIVELEVTDHKALVKDYLVGWRQHLEGEHAVVVPHVRYMTNDSWELISGLTATTGHPILHDGDFGRAHLYLLTIPDNFDDLYKLPERVLADIRRVVMADLPVCVNGPSQVALFLYDNDTFVVESFLPETAPITIVVGEGCGEIRDVISGEVLSGTKVPGFRGVESGKVAYETTLDPHTFRVFRSA